MRHLAVLLCLTIINASLAADATIYVQGQSHIGNPTVFVTPVRGDRELTDLLRSTLTYSDWFRTLRKKAAADYVLTFSVSDDGDSHHLQLADKSGTEIVSLETPVSVGGTDIQAYDAIDKLLQAVFQTPGLCEARLAYVKEIDGVKEIYTADFNGANPKPLTANGSLSVEPHWGGDRRYLAYTLYRRFNTDIVLVDLAMNRRRRLTQSIGLNSGAALSNSGDRVAMTLSRGRNVDLYVMNLPEDEPRQLTTSDGLEASPCWSPDDSKLCFVSDRQGRPRLYLMPAAGGAPQRLLADPSECVSPSWSVVSNKICFSMRQGNRYVIAMVEMSNATLPKDNFKVLVDKSGDWESPSWAPDGRHIVCSRTTNRSGKALYMVDSLFGTVFPLQNFTGDDASPTYSPLP
ncbi:MAG TPA: hypothetical protein DIT01_15015 [Lentisphaeria bacterium]|nr:hypothetical protein [Lentisphaeria bacterium]